MDSPPLRVTEEQIAAAQLRLMLDEKLGRQTPELVRRIAAITGVELTERQHPSPEAHTVAARMSRSEEVTRSADEAWEEANQWVEKVVVAARAMAAGQTRPAAPAGPQLEPPSINAPGPIQNPLTLVMTAKSPQDYAILQQTIKQLQSLPPEKNPITIALNNLANVHFARFVFLDHNQLAVITIYDGDFGSYANDFIDKLGAVFNMLLTHIEDSPPLPVETHRQEFLAFVRAHDLRCEAPFYSAYPNRTVLDIIDMASAASKAKPQ